MPRAAKGLIMAVNIEQAKELIKRCLTFRDKSAVEAVLRSEFLSRLRVVFPDAQDDTWINHYTKGTEAHTTIGKSGGITASRFIDNLVGSTTIEYEVDLRVPRNGTRVTDRLRNMRQGFSGLAFRYRRCAEFSLTRYIGMPMTSL